MNHTLAKKVGPLPVWGWAAAIALGAVIYYWQKHNSGGQAAVGNALAAAQPQLDPTAGNLDMPSGLSSGGTGPTTSDAVGYPTSGDIADAVSQQLAPILATLPYASAPGAPSDGGTGNGVAELVSTIQSLRDAGIIQTLPAASTGAATSTAQSHTKPTHVSERVNRKVGNPRAGQVYRVVTNPHGHPKGTYHVYSAGLKTPKYVKVK